MDRSIIIYISHYRHRGSQTFTQWLHAFRLPGEPVTETEKDRPPSTSWTCSRAVCWASLKLSRWVGSKQESCSKVFKGKDEGHILYHSPPFFNPGFHMPHERRNQDRSAQNFNQASELLGDPSASKHRVLTPWQHVKTLTSLWGCTRASLVVLTPLWTDHTAWLEPSSSPFFSLGSRGYLVSASAHQSQLRHDLLFPKMPSPHQSQTYTYYGICNVTLFSSLKGRD